MPPKKTPEMVTKLLKKVVDLKGQSAVASETGLTQPAISRYLRGFGEPTTETLKKLADYFGVSLYQLRGEDQLVDEAIEKWFIPLHFYSLLAETIERHLDKALKYDKYSDNSDFIDATIAMSSIYIDGYVEFCDSGCCVDLKFIKQKADAVIDKFIGQSSCYYVAKDGNYSTILSVTQPYDAKLIEEKIYRERKREIPLAWRRDKNKDED